MTGASADDTTKMPIVTEGILHLITLDGSSIDGVADLKGKRVAIGPAGGGTIPFLGQVLELAGLSIDDITPSQPSYADGFRELADGNVDKAFALSGYSAGSVLQAQANTKLKFIPLSDTGLAMALESYPNDDRVVVPADVYKTDSDGIVLGVVNLLTVDASRMLRGPRPGSPVRLTWSLPVNYLRFE